MKVKQDRYGARSVAQKNFEPYPNPGDWINVEIKSFTYKNKSNLQISELFADPSRSSVQPLTRDMRHASVGKESRIGVLSPSPFFGLCMDGKNDFSTLEKSLKQLVNLGNP